MKKYWLMKSEPNCFSIDDLACQKVTSWDGVRNYQARNFMWREMKIKDEVFFYHSNCKPPGIVGVAEICSEAYPDYSAWDINSEHSDPRSTLEKPLWYMVDIKFKEKFSKIISLDDLKNYDELCEMQLLRRGNRLSVLPISLVQWNFINNLR